MAATLGPNSDRFGVPDSGYATPASETADLVKDVVQQEKSEEPKVYRDTYGNDFMLPEFTMKQIYAAIPAHCFERPLWKSASYVARDALQTLAAFYAASHIQYIPNFWVRCAAWQVYAFVQGLTWFGIWILAHECGHGAFHANQKVCDAFGWVLHSFVGMPYNSWKWSHNKHHKATGNIDRDTAFNPRVLPPAKKAPRAENEPTEEEEAEHAALHDDHHEEGLFSETPIYTLYSLVLQQLFGLPLYLAHNATGQPYDRTIPLRVSHYNPWTPIYGPNNPRFWAVVCSDLGLGLMGLGLWYASKFVGWSGVALYWFVPYLWVNHWLVIITYLQHTDPTLPHYRNKAWTFERGATATIDREFGFIGRKMFHCIIETHVLHHLVSRIPHYHAEEATEAIKGVMGRSYRYDPRGMWGSLYRVARWCQAVPAEGDVVFYKNANGLNYDDSYKAKTQ
ncbi:hypothetical protein YB2330_001521 [Saitoella coloradoensis]